MYPLLSLEVATPENKSTHWTLSSIRMSASKAVLCRMPLTLHATRPAPHGASRLVQAMRVWSVKTRRAPFRHCRDARVYGYTTTVMCDTPPPTAPRRLDDLTCVRQTALEIARSLVVGYIEEEDDMETDKSDEDEDGGGGGSSSGADDFSGRLPTWLHRPSQSGSDSEGNERRATTRAPYRNPRAAHMPLASQPSVRSGRLASWPGPASSGDEADGSRRKSFERGRRTSILRPAVFSDGGGGSGSDNNADDGERKETLVSDGSNDGEHRRPSSTPAGDSKMRWKNAAAAVTKRANSKPLRMKSFGVDAGSDDELGRKLASTHDSKKGLQRGGTAAVGPAMTLSAEAAAIANAASPPPKTPPVGTRNGAEAVPGGKAVLKTPPVGTRNGAEEVSGGKAVLPAEQVTTPFWAISAAPVSSVSSRRPERSPSGRRQDRSPSGRWQDQSPSARSKSFVKPVALDHPVTGNGTASPPGTKVGGPCSTRAWLQAASAGGEN